MNTYDYYTDITEQFTFPDAPDSGTAKATVFYEWGDTVVAQTSAVLVTGNTYSITIPDEKVDSFGTWRIKWECTLSTAAFYSYTNFQVERKYTSEDAFMALYPEFNNVSYQGAQFNNAERLARQVIDVYTGQNFQRIKGKTLVIDGSGRSTLHLPYRLNWFTASSINSVDYTAASELDPTSKYFLRLKKEVDVIDGPISVNTFSKDVPVSITGDWGWVDVPWQIEQATQLLIVDLLNDTRREMHRYGISRLWQDTNRVELKPGIFNTTGNTDVDVLIMDFIYWTLDYVT